MIRIDEIKNYNNLVKQRKAGKIGILGFGVENRQFLEWLLKVGQIGAQNVVIFDKKQIDIKELEKYGLEDKNLVFGEDYLERLLKMQEQIEVVYKAPGIWALKPELEVLRAIRGQDFVQSPLVFFLNKFGNQVIGVTGTKGKSTTCNFLNQLLNSEVGGGLGSVYCGNTTGVSPYQYWERLDQEADLKKFFVVELSSFQLQDLGYAKLSPKYSIISNVFVDHLDQHSNVDEYWQAKEQIFKYVSEDGFVVAFEQVLENLKSLEKVKNKIVVHKAQVKSFFDEDVLRELHAVGIIGEHNRINLLLAYLMCIVVVFGLRDKFQVYEKGLQNKGVLKKAVKDLKMLGQRLELVRSLVTNFVRGVEKAEVVVNFYDDGVATQPDAVVAGIKAVMETENSYLWLQLSGVDKGSDLNGLVEVLKQLTEAGRVYRIDFFGEVGQNVKLGLEASGVDLGKIEVGSGKMRDFLEVGFGIDDFMQKNQGLGVNEGKIAQKIAEKFLDQVVGRVEEQGLRQDLEKNQSKVLQVLLSPAGSSFDEFENYHQRSKMWVEAVEKIS
jgi:UDP-N-acetylmuramoylalanine--D-glutamate ligase